MNRDKVTKWLRKENAFRQFDDDDDDDILGEEWTSLKETQQFPPVTIRHFALHHIQSGKLHHHAVGISNLQV
jgi:hypothetical protein